MVEVLGVERRLTIGAAWKQVTVGFEGRVDHFQHHGHPPGRWRTGEAKQIAGRLYLPFSYDRQHHFHPRLEHLPRQAIESDLGVISHRQTQLAVLPHPGHIGVILMGHKHHRRTQRHLHSVDTGPQHHLGDIAARGGTHHRIVQLELGNIELRLQIIDAGVCHIDIAPIAQVALGHLAGTIKVGLGRNQLRLDRLHSVFKRNRIDAKQHLALFHDAVALHRHLNHHPADCRHDGRADEVAARHLGIGMVVVHQEDQATDQHDAAEDRGRYGPLVQRNLEDLEDGHADGGVGQDQ